MPLKTGSLIIIYFLVKLAHRDLISSTVIYVYELVQAVDVHEYMQLLCQGERYCSDYLPEVSLQVTDTVVVIIFLHTSFTVPKIDCTSFSRCILMSVLKQSSLQHT